jgi:hypothetical protein
LRGLVLKSSSIFAIPEHADHLLMQNELNAQERRKIIDKVAAAVILQGWLDRRKEQMAQGQTQ